MSDPLSKLVCETGDTISCRFYRKKIVETPVREASAVVDYIREKFSNDKKSLNLALLTLALALYRARNTRDISLRVAVLLTSEPERELLFSIAKYFLHAQNPLIVSQIMRDTIYTITSR